MTTVDPDAKLAAVGDRDAFEKIYRRYHYRVYCLCLRMTRNVSQAEDLAQDVFIQLFRKINTFRGESSFATWLYRLTVNQVPMHFRKPTVKTEQTTEDGTTPVRIASGTENPGKMSVIDRISLGEAIRQLPMVTGPCSSCTTWTGMNMNRLDRCSDAQLGPRSRNCTKLA